MHSIQESMAEKVTISFRVKEDLEDRFEEYRDKKGLSKSGAGRMLLKQALDSEENDADEAATRDAGGGFLDRVLPPSIAVFLGATFLLYALGHTDAALEALFIGGVAALGVQHTDNPLDAQERYLKAYSIVTAAGIVFLLLVSQGLLVWAGGLEVVIFAAAGLLLFSQRNTDLSLFARSRSIELGMLFGGGILVVSSVTGVSSFAAEAGALLVAVGWLGVSIATLRMALTLARATETETPSSGAAR